VLSAWLYCKQIC